MWCLGLVIFFWFLGSQLWWQICYLDHFLVAHFVFWISFWWGSCVFIGSCFGDGGKFGLFGQMFDSGIIFWWRLFFILASFFGGGCVKM